MSWQRKEWRSKVREEHKKTKEVKTTQGKDWSAVRRNQKRGKRETPLFDEENVASLMDRLRLGRKKNEQQIHL